MIATILIQQHPRVSRKIERRQKVLIESPAAHNVNGTLAHMDRACGKKSQRR